MVLFGRPVGGGWARRNGWVVAGRPLEGAAVEGARTAVSRSGAAWQGVNPGSRGDVTKPNACNATLSPTALGALREGIAL